MAWFIPTCVVLVVHLKRPVLWHCSVVVPGPGGSSWPWSRHEYPHELITDDLGEAMRAVGKLTAARGNKFRTPVFAADDDAVELLMLEFSPAPVAGSPVFTTAPAVISPWLPGYFRLRVVESGGDMYAVRVSLDLVRGREVVDIYVYKLVMSSENVNTWVKVDGLGDDGRVFFLGKGGFGTSMAADEVGLEANCIYFTNEDDKGLYVYHMKQGSISLHNPGPDVPDDSLEPMILMRVIT